jgi:nucleoid DNA-binding protein
MNEKITLQDLVNLLVERQNITKKDAETFVKAIFDLIEEVLERERSVKVKGLGIFKLIEVNTRESVNINTGERFEIQGHSKISFFPESSVKDLINKPFAHFEAVPLNDDTVLEDTLESTDSALDEFNEDLENSEDLDEQREISDSRRNAEAKGGEAILQSEDSVNLKEPVSVESTEQESGEALLQSEISVDLGESGETSDLMENTDREKEDASLQSEYAADLEIAEDKSLIVKPENQEEDVEKKNIEDVLDNPTESDKTKSEEKELEKKKTEIRVRKGWYVALVLLLVCVFIGYKLYDRKGGAEEPLQKTIDIQKQNPEKEFQQTPSEQPLDKGTLSDSISSSRTEEISKKESSTSSHIFSSKEEYDMIGTLQEHTISSGETLRKISLKYYGTKELYSYIVRYNSDIIKNPDNVPVGTVIKIPELRQK